jgi:hypothetical protein
MVPDTARHGPQQRTTGVTVTKTGMCRWNRDGNRNEKEVICGATGRPPGALFSRRGSFGGTPTPSQTSTMPLCC